LSQEYKNRTAATIAIFFKRSSVHRNTKKVKNIKFRCCKIVVRLRKIFQARKVKGFPEDSIYFVKLEESESGGYDYRASEYAL
jgi:hypothetical protein